MNINEYIDLESDSFGFSVRESIATRDKKGTGELNGEYRESITYHPNMRDALKKIYFILLGRKKIDNVDDLLKKIQEAHNEIYHIMKEIEDYAG